MSYSSFAKMYYFSFFGGGAFYMFIAKYLLSIGFTGSQIGVITSMGALIVMIFQPLWGYLSDRKDKTTEILITMLLATIIIVSILPFVKTYLVVLIIFMLFYIFQSGMSPIQDSMALKSPFEYGKLRQWGSIGFAISVAMTGFLIDKINIYVIFVILIFSYILAILAIKRIKIPKKLKEDDVIHLKEVLKLFKNKKYTLFLLASFFVWGTVSTHNTYFAVYYEGLGGTMSGVGLAVLLFAGSEVPFMIYAEKVIKKVGLEMILIFATLMFFVRWIWYFYQPSPILVITFFIIQGLSIGIYIVAATMYIKKNVRKEYRGTALAIYASVGGGFSSVIYLFFSGKILDAYGVKYIYMFLGIGTLIGLVFLIKLYMNAKKGFAK